MRKCLFTSGTCQTCEIRKHHDKFAKMTVFHDEIEIEDMEYDEDTETYYYPCPCGDRFEITKVRLL